MNNKNLPGIIHAGLAVLSIALLVLAFSFSFKIVDRMRGEVAAAKSALPTIGRKPSAVSMVFWPNNFSPINYPVADHEQLPVENNNIVVLQNMNHTGSVGYYWSRFTDTPFIWKNQQDSGDQDTKARMYGYTTAPCGVYQDMRMEIWPVRDNIQYYNHGVVFPNTDQWVCGPNGDGTNWFKTVSGLPNGGFNNEPIYELFFRAAPIKLGTNYFWNISKLDVCNPDVGGTGCELATWPPVQVLGTVVTPKQMCSDATTNAKNAISWEPIVNATDYQVDACAGASCTNFANVATVPATQPTRFIHQGLVDDTYYRYRVRGHNSNENVYGIWSNPVSVKVDPTCTTFVSSKKYTGAITNGNNTGLVAADLECQAMADTATLDGTFKAWLSTDAAGGDAVTRISNSKYRLVTGVQVADSKSDLIDSDPLTSVINKTELGATSSERFVYTGTLANGQNASNTCYNWTSSNQAHNANVGDTQSTTGAWTNYSSTLPCSYNNTPPNNPTMYPIYCFQTDGLIGNGY